MFDNPSSRWYSKTARKRPRIPRTHSKAGTTYKSEDLSGELQGETEGFQPTETKGDLIYRHHLEPRVQHHVPREEETFPIPLKRIDDYWNVTANRSLSDH